MAKKDPIHIKASRRGLFTEEAKKHHETDTQFEHTVLADPKRFSKAEVKRARFAEEAKKWHHK